MRKKLIAMLLGSWIAGTGYAQIAVFDSAALGQMMEEMMELESQTRELTSHTTSLQASIKRLGTYQWSNDDMLSLMDSLSDNMRQYSKIAYSAADLDKQFTTFFPGYDAKNDYQSQYQDNVNETMKTLNGSLKTIGMNAGNFSSESARLGRLHDHVQSAEGQTQVIQAMGEMSEELVTQTQSLRQIVSAQANAETAYYAQQIQKQATTQANMNAVLAAGSTEDVVYGSNPDDIIG